MTSFQASEWGQNKIREARKRRGWSIEDPRWLVEASKVLEPDKHWIANGPYADGSSLPTWKRFLKGAPIRPESFKAFAQVLGLDIEDLLESEANQNFEIPQEQQESECGSYQITLQSGSLPHIKVPKYRRHTQLIGRVGNNSYDFEIVVLNFQHELDSVSFNGLEEFLRAFCIDINDTLKLSNNFEE